MDKNPFEILGISPDASLAEIKKKFRLLALKYHPDRHKELYHKIWAEEKFKEITQAYHILSDPEKRAFYKMVYYTGFYDDIINEYTTKESKPDSYYEKDWPDSSHEFDYELWLMLLYIPHGPCSCFIRGFHSECHFVSIWFLYCFLLGVLYFESF